ncbi:dephospho-CoA kinase [uncultured Clostridium sp.]|uniref:dephospho-CoA kinase n=1 Tax=uncultured Clostridium sp. TaxID=59620 RepID=UPI00260BE482|nr:dephospho-CoA kinase [uncultured Clostridium sp.]
MIKIGLTGGICSGKSTISLMLQNVGFKVIDADVIAREVLEENPYLLNEIKLHFGENFFDWRGDFRRKEFGNHIFRFAKERIKYESLIMPYIRKAIEAEFEFHKKNKEKLVILDGATLIENGYNEELDMMILVFVKQTIQIQRIKERDKLTQNEAVNRINSQWSMEKKKEQSNLIIDNNGNLIKTKEQVDDLVKFLKIYKK